MSKQAWVTLATNDSYALGALVLAHSLRRVNSAYPAVVLVTPSVSDNMRTRLSAVFAEVVTVDVLDSRDAAHLALLARPELGITFTKMHCWTLTQYDKCVFLDADALVLQNSDELFEREELSAAPDVGWPDCFNSGVFVFRPSEATFESLLQFAKERGSFDGGDQGLLNSYFSTWAHGDIGKHLPFVYNVTSVAFYSYLPALKQFGEGVKIVHFIGNAKPWLQQFNWESRTVDAAAHIQPSLQFWWDIFVDDVHSQLDEAMTGLAGTLARLTLGPVSGQRAALDEHTRRQGWEAGNIDYMGADAFDNIWAKISATLAGGQADPSPAPTQETAPAPLQEPSSAQGPAPVSPSGEVPPSPAPTPAETATVEPAVPRRSAPEPSAERTEALASVATEQSAPAVLPAAVETSVKPVEVSKALEAAAPASEELAPEPTQLDAANAEPTTPAPIPLESKAAVAATVEPAPAHLESITLAPVEPTMPSPVQKIPPAPTPVGPAKPTPLEPASPTPVEPIPAPLEPATSTPVEAVPAPVEAALSPVEPATPTPVEAAAASVQAVPAPVRAAPAPVQASPAPTEPAPLTPVKPVPTPVEPATPSTESTPFPVEVPKAESSPVIVAALAESKADSSSIVEAAPATPEQAPQSTSTESPPLVSTPDKDAVSPKSDEEGAQETRL